MFTALFDKYETFRSILREKRTEAAKLRKKHRELDMISDYLNRNHYPYYIKGLNLWHELHKLAATSDDADVLRAIFDEEIFRLLYLEDDEVNEEDEEWSLYADHCGVMGNVNLPDDCIRILIEKISIGENVCVFGEFVGVNYKYITPETQALIDHNIELYKDDYFANVELYKDEDGKWRKRELPHMKHQFWWQKTQDQ